MSRNRVSVSLFKKYGSVLSFHSSCRGFYPKLLVVFSNILSQPPSQQPGWLFLITLQLLPLWKLSFIQTALKRPQSDFCTCHSSATTLWKATMMSQVNGVSPFPSYFGSSTAFGTCGHLDADAPLASETWILLPGQGLCGGQSQNHNIATDFPYGAERKRGSQHCKVSRL